MRDVTIYRLICRGTIEEKIYQRQIFKLLLTSRILDDPKQKALFTKSDIKELFQFNDDDDDELKENSKNNSNNNTATNNNKNYNNNNSKNINSNGKFMKSSDLPIEGEVILSHKSKGKDKGISNGKGSSQLGTIAVYESDNGGQSRRNRIDVDEKFKIDSETFIEENISLNGTSSSSSRPSGSGDPTFVDVDGQDSHSRDKRLLQALFDGEALSAVYDHSHIEPGMGGSDAAREAGALQKQAAFAVNQAVKQLQASAPSYRMNEERTLVSSSSSSSKSSQPRFGGTSSSSVLAGLRANKASVGLGSTSASGHNLLRSNSSSTPSVSPGNIRGNIEVTSNPQTSIIPVSMTGDILKRLNMLFTMNVNKSHIGSRCNGLSTDYILHHFSDLGDQYASIFKDSLHSVAVMKDGKWYIK